MAWDGICDSVGRANIAFRHNSVADPGFSRGGAWTLQGGREHAKFSRKLHEIERIWTPRGGRASLTPPLDPPMQFFVNFPYFSDFCRGWKNVALCFSLLVGLGTPGCAPVCHWRCVSSVTVRSASSTTSTCVFMTSGTIWPLTSQISPFPYDSSYCAFKTFCRYVV